MYSIEAKDGKVPFEEALGKTGYGLYSYLIIALAGASTISFVALIYGSTIIVPASACELETTTAQQGLVVGVPVAVSTGALIGSLLWGFLGDTRGRRRMLLVSLALGAASNALASISVNWIMLMIIQLCTVTLGSGIYVLSMTLLSESVPLQKRNVAMVLVSSVFLLSQGILSVMSIPIIPLTFSYHLEALGIYWNSWRTLQVVYSLPCLICAVFWVFMQESPKYVLASGNEDQALKILRTIHRLNNCRRGEELQVKALLQEKDATSEKKSNVKEQIAPLFKKPYLKSTLIMASLFMFNSVVAFVVWAPSIFNQLMTLLETKEGSDLTLCQIIATEVDVDPDAAPCSINSTAMLLLLAMCALQSVFNTILSLIVDKAGRRNTAMAVASVCGLSGVLVNLVPNAIGTAVLFAVFSLGGVTSGFYTAIAVALFPTRLRFVSMTDHHQQPFLSVVSRTMAMALQMVGARLMSVVLIQIINYLLVNSCELGFYLFSILFASSALVLALLPDDRQLLAPLKQPNPEIVDEQHEQRTSI
ncbi:solute carrier family 22 member 11-like [Cydia strobilella]|uniref:solute carrier family 22 member 11-like n=1 Tax=Cydia strobilella TaxID=1100964 RepID=UPI003003E7E9